MSYKDPEKQKAYDRSRALKRFRETRASWLRANGPCVQCGSWDRLEVDHVDPAQKVSSHVWSWSEGRRLAELAKCQVLCYDCHRAKTIASLKKPQVHGTMHSYDKCKCRCVLCRKAIADYQRGKYAQRKKEGRLKSQVGRVKKRKPSLSTP